MKYSELRQNPATKEWVVFAPEHPVFTRVKIEKQPAYDSECPFCPGNETLTPPEILRFPSNSSISGWQVRVVPDKFAVLSPDFPPIKDDGFFRRMAGFGHHEIVIEHPRHNADISDMPVQDVLQVLKAYRARQRELAHDKHIRTILIFRTHGAAAGACCSHPHSQILATAVVPELIHRKQEIAKSHSGSTQRNLYSEIREAEDFDDRMIERDESMCVFVPFAASVPYEMWIMPEEPRPSFAQATDRDLEGLAGALRRSVLRLKHCCGDVAYSYVIYSCAIGHEGPYFQWHLQITPRLARPAGAELGPHICINPMLPEESAKALREAPSKETQELLAARS